MSVEFSILETCIQDMPIPRQTKNPNPAAGYDIQWFEKIRRGDTKAFEDVFREYYPGLFRFTWHYLKSSEDAEEVVQEVFTRIWERREQIHPSGSLKAYIFKMAKNLALDSIRHERIVRGWEEDVTQLFEQTGQSPEDQLDDKLLLQDLEKAIKNLPDRCRMVFLMSRYDGLSYSEIADVLGITVNTVETQISRALKVLRKHLSPYVGALAFLDLVKQTLS